MAPPHVRHIPELRPAMLLMTIGIPNTISHFTLIPGPGGIGAVPTMINGMQRDPSSIPGAVYAWDGAEPSSIPGAAGVPTMINGMQTEPSSIPGAVYAWYRAEPSSLPGADGIAFQHTWSCRPFPRDRFRTHVYSHLDREAVPWHRLTGDIYRNYDRQCRR